MAKGIFVSKSEMSNFDEMREAYAKVLTNDAQGLKGIYQKNPDAMFSPITAFRDTIFHIAAYKGSEEVLQVLVKMVPQSKKRELLKMKNIYGNTILHEVATTTNLKSADLLIRELLFSDGPLNHENDIREREEILADRNKFGETPLFRAAEYGNKMMVMYLAREIERVGNLQNHYKRDDGFSILHIAVIGQHFGLPSDSCNEDEIDELSLNLQNKDLEQGEPSKALNQSGRSKGFKFYGTIWKCLAEGWKMIDRMWSQKRMHASAVKLAKILVRTDASWFEPHEPEEDDMICLERKLEEEERVTKSAASGMESPEPDTPLFIAASTGIVEIVNEILNVYPQAVEHISKTGQNILHVAILHRTYKVFNLVKNKEEATRLVRGIDNHVCTILHHAADTKYYHGGTKPTHALKLQQELTWFEVVKNLIPSHFTMHRNKKNMTADQLFKDMHLEQLKTAQDWVKNTSQSCSTVSVLVASVVFAAAYAAPGGFVQNNGRPVLLEKPLYSFFTVMDVAGLASSLTSVVIFLSILTSSHDPSKPLPWLHLSLLLWEEKPKEVVEIESLKKALVDSFYGTDRGLKASSETRAEIVELITQLEAKNPTPAPTEALPLLNGKWILAYTSFPGLFPLLSRGQLPLVKVEEISQTIDAESLTVQNSVQFSGPLASSSISTNAKFEVRSPKRVQIKFLEGIIGTPQLTDSIVLPENVEFLGQKIDLTPIKGLLTSVQDTASSVAKTISNRPPLKIPLSNSNAGSWLLTTYFDEDLRISRGDAGSVFVLIKEGSALLTVDPMN
ncbi:hypothetical protein REPUB_Repub13aG0272000 [Reevesia pubescens]